MAESRDRLSRPFDIAAMFARRRSGILGVYQEQPDLERDLASPIPRPSPVGRGRVVAGRGRNMYRAPATARENRAVGSNRRGTGNGRGRASNSVLPSWYPRTTLRDITAIVRALERRRESLGRNRAEEIVSPMPHPYGVGNSTELSLLKTPKPSTQLKVCPPPSVAKVSKILLAVTSEPTKDSEFLTPQKKLLNSIDKVEKQVMQELQRHNRTASAKRAEREKRVKTLMSLR